jgi:hypothetical protein
MKSLARIGWVALVCLILAACATGGPKYAEVSKSVKALAPGDARVYVYRTAMLGMAVQPEVRLDGAVVGRAQPNGFFYVDCKPGAHEIVTTTEVDRKLTFTLEPGQTRYVRLGISMGFFVGHVYPELVDNAAAESEITGLSFTGTP